LTTPAHALSRVKRRGYATTRGWLTNYFGAGRSMRRVSPQASFDF
jgi:hypothetical protein